MEVLSVTFSDAHLGQIHVLVQPPQAGECPAIHLFPMLIGLPAEWR